LQAGGHRFESGCLHKRLPGIRCQWSLMVENCFHARKGHGIVAVLFLRKNVFAHVNRHKSAILFFVRVNQVLVRLWARNRSFVIRCRVSEVSDRRPPETKDGSPLRLMSDRESVSVVSTPRFGF
jgi:hypothetical protein